MIRKFRNLFLVIAVLACAGLYGAIKVHYLPSDFQGSVFHIAEGTFGVFHLSAPGAVKKAPAKGTLVIDLPAEIRLIGSANVFNRSKDGVIQDKITQKAVKRNGKNFTRYEVRLSRKFLQSTARRWGWEYNNLFFLASPGSAGKSFKMYSTLILGKEKSPEKTIEFKVLPALKKPAKPAKYFTLGQHLISSVYTVPDHLREKQLDIWRGLTAAPVKFAVRPAYPDSMKQYAGYEGFWTMGANYTAPKMDYRGYTEMKPYPVDKKGNPSPAFCAENPENKISDYVSWCIRRYRKEMPHIRKMYWNIEPTQDKFGRYDLEVFAGKMKLAKVPTAGEVVKMYPEQWRRFRVDTTMRVIRIVTDTVKKEFPELKFMLCGIPLELRYPGGLNPNSAVDLRIADKFPGVDFHIPMQYYSGVALFDDVDFTLKNIKKPLLGMQDFNEPSLVWYLRYTPQQVLQNIVLYAVLGAEGYHSFPRDNYDHRYIKSFYDAYSIISHSGEIWKKGRDISKNCSVKVVSAIPVKYKTADGKWHSAALNSGEKELRSRIHRLGRETAVSLFNFDSKRACFVKVTVPGIAPDAQVILAPDTRLICNGRAVTGKDLADGLLLKLPADSVLVLTAGGKYVPEKTLNISGYAKELEQLLSELRKNSSGMYTAQKGKICASDWAPRDGKFHLRLIAAGGKKIWIDPDTAAVVSWQNPLRWGKPRIVRHIADYLNSARTSGFVGRIAMISSAGRREIKNFKLDMVKTDDFYNEAVFSAQVPRYQGIEQWNDPLEGLRFTVRYLQSDSGFDLIQKITLKNLNPRKETIKGVLLLRSFAANKKAGILAEMSGGRLFFDDSSCALLKEKAGTPFKIKVRHGSWRGDKVLLIPRANKKKRIWFSCVPDPSCSGMYSWSDLQTGRTAEFFTPEFALAPGEEKTFTFSFGIGAAAPADQNYQEQKR